MSEASDKIKMGESAGFTFSIVRQTRKAGRKLACCRINGSLHIARGRIDVATKV